MKATNKAKAYMKQYYQSNKDKIKARSANRALKVKESNPYYQVCAKYKMTQAEVEEQLNNQFGVCLICSEPETTKDNYGRVRRLSVDHDHKTGQPRAFLCSKCNSAVGLIKEDPRIAVNLLNYINMCKA